MTPTIPTKQAFSIRRYARGAASVLIGTSLLLGSQLVAADQHEPINTEPTPLNLAITEAAPPILNPDLEELTPNQSSDQESHRTEDEVSPEPAITHPEETTNAPILPANTEQGENPLIHPVTTDSEVNPQARPAEPRPSEEQLLDKPEPEKPVLVPQAVAETTAEETTPSHLSPTDAASETADQVVTDPELEKGPSSDTSFRRTQATDQLAPSGTYHFTSTLGIKAEPKLDSPDLATYSAGQSVNYDRLLEADQHQWISYIAHSGNRRYIAVKALEATNDNKGQVTQANLGAKGIDLTYTGNQASDLSKILFAVWSDKKGQDDLKWYNANAQGKTTATFDNHDGYGLYHIHTYKNENGQNIGLNSRTFTMPSPKMTSTITKVNDSTVEIHVSAPSYISSVTIPVWSDKGGQDDLKWYKAEKQDATNYKLTVSATNHKSDLGRYHAHVYGKSQLEDNRTIGLGTTTGFEVNRIVDQYTSPHGRPKYEANTYPAGQCTWGVKEIAPWANNWWGNGGDWADSARRDGFTVGDKPVVGAIAVWPNVYWQGVRYGHVGLVTEVVNDNLIRTLESNVDAKMYIADHRGLFNPKASYMGGAVSYIYPPSR